MLSFRWNEERGTRNRIVSEELFLSQHSILQADFGVWNLLFGVCSELET